MFDAKRAAEGCIRWIRDWYDKNGKGCVAVIGMSGGKDSSVDAALCARALGPDRVIGVMLPQDNQADIQDSKDIIEFLGIKSYEFNIGQTVSKMHWELEKSCVDIRMSQQARENLPPRIRMASLYFISQCLNGRVVNNCNASEDYIGYSTHYGDDAGDFSPISCFTVTEVIEIGRYLGIPERFLVKAPSDGLCGKTDEEKIGFTYAVLDKFIRTGMCEDEEIKKRIITMHDGSAFKRKPMDHYNFWEVSDISGGGVASDILTGGWL